MKYQGVNYTDADLFLKDKSRRKIANNTYLQRLSENTIGVILYNTCIVTYFKNKGCSLNSGGWKTATTKNRLNKYSPCHVIQKDYTWYVVNEATLREYYVVSQMSCWPGVPFYDGILI
tara:strand:- start:696 stop:1049 length:354 start_codon:yes stop_codon:yes gene_type:complete